MDDAEMNGRAVAPERPRFHLRLQTAPNSSSELRRSLRAWLEDVGVSDRDAFDVTLACSEAFANAVGGRVEPGAAIVEVDAELDARRVLTIVVHERTRRGLGQSSERSREETRVFLRLMETLMESAESHARADGMTLVLRKRLGFWHGLPAV
jgi:anti-sigma regulatory factor (Ser/Thr protein kinase)